MKGFAPLDPQRTVFEFFNSLFTPTAIAQCFADYTANLAVLDKSGHSGRGQMLWPP
jgi:hypothetical protein